MIETFQADVEIVDIRTELCQCGDWDFICQWYPVEPNTPEDEDLADEDMTDEDLAEEDLAEEDS